MPPTRASRPRSTAPPSALPVPWPPSCPWLWCRPKSESVLPKVIRWDGIETFEAALGERKGVILLTPHIGSWELFGQAVGERFMATHGPITALFRPPRKELMAGLMDGSRDRPGLQTLPTTVAGVRGLMRALRAGGYTGILPDQVPPEGQGVWRHSSASRPTRSPCLPGWHSRPGRTCSSASASGCRAAPAMRSGSSPSMARPSAIARRRRRPPPAALNAGIEGLIRSLPGQYVWDYARYKQPRAEQETAQ